MGQTAAHTPARTHARATKHFKPSAGRGHAHARGTRVSPNPELLEGSHGAATARQPSEALRRPSVTSAHKAAGTTQRSQQNGRIFSRCHGRWGLSRVPASTTWRHARCVWGPASVAKQPAHQVWTIGRAATRGKMMGRLGCALGALGSVPPQPAKPLSVQAGSARGHGGQAGVRRPSSVGRHNLRGRAGARHGPGGRRPLARACARAGAAPWAQHHEAHSVVPRRMTGSVSPAG